MSRIGNKAVEIPAKVKVNIGADGSVAVEGPKGKLSWNLPRSIKGSVQDNRISIVTGPPVSNLIFPAWTAAVQIEESSV